MRKWLLALAVGLGGCGPSFEQVAGTGLAGAVLYAPLAWLTLVGVRRVADRLRAGAWQPVLRAPGVVPVVAFYGLVSVAALIWAPQVRDDTWIIVLPCAASNFITWALLAQLVTGFGVAGSLLLAGLFSLGPAVGGALAHEGFAIATIYQWLWGGFFGAAPALITLIIWLAAWAPRPHAGGDD